ncbi:MAG: Glycogen synthase, ADP-glucose transglucosylase (EC [uncultured Thiotrichaceae bacterium]|uniref:Glycogen synthase n=1 Tax=uncultured Thiotrichaceae bacterium TaxID=298394 RepID=A0A6S6U3X8_9GAMM|nr:MAG: Glycogen synthase, ADP-glucose transglucosylase (EC [uncultured Thiotrichaceae bacterium]
MKVLFASSEVWPLLKTGGLADVSYSLPHALYEEGTDIRLVMPAYRKVLESIESFSIAGWLTIELAGKSHNIRVLSITHPEFSIPVWLIDDQHLFDREGNPYSHPDGYEWPDSAERFTIFAKAVSQLAMDALNIGWKAEVVHSNDWQTGLVSAFLEEETERPRRVFTIHNMAYGGYFSHDEFRHLQLPAQWWSANGVEFYGNFSMLKAGIVYSDAVTTVSPTYAKEICTPEFGCGLEAVLRHRQYKLSGILNGIDTNAWNPSSDSLIPYHFSEKRRNPGKRKNKKALLEAFGAHVDEKKLNAPLLGLVSRLVEQKGVDMVLEVIPQILANTDATFVLKGSGHGFFENRLRQLAAAYPEHVFISIGYDEAEAHLVEAGSDIFLMPSRFEPCGLNQLYSLAYGTLPIVHRTGGLADTVMDAYMEDGETLNPEANGFVFTPPTTEALYQSIEKALDLYAQKTHWNHLQRNAMNGDYGWTVSAQAYLDIYKNSPNHY